MPDLERMQDAITNCVLAICDEEYDVLSVKDLGVELVVNRHPQTGEVQGFRDQIPTECTIEVLLSNKKALREAVNSLTTMTQNRDAVLRWYGLNHEVVATVVLTRCIVLKLVQSKTAAGAPTETVTLAPGAVQYDAQA